MSQADELIELLQTERARVLREIPAGQAVLPGLRRIVRPRKLTTTRAELRNMIDHALACLPGGEYGEYFEEDRLLDYWVERAGRECIAEILPSFTPNPLTIWEQWSTVSRKVDRAFKQGQLRVVFNWAIEDCGDPEHWRVHARS